MKDAAAEVYEQLLTRIGEAHPRPRIEPVRRLAELTGSPQLSYPVIQVAGTNGKTSTSRAIESLLRAHGLRTGLFTSPHLVDFTERFVLSGETVAAEALAAAWEELQLPLTVVDRELSEQGQSPITFFEALAVLAFTVFADAPVDVAVVEVGMGGEWDATNIADAAVAVFTPIDLDHTAILGPDIQTIARTKAGIIKPGTRAVSAPQTPAALTEIRAAAERAGASLTVLGEGPQLVDDILAVGGRQIRVSGVTGHAYEPVFLPLFGGHQAANAALAIAAAELFFGGERPIADPVLEEGLGQLTSPGRLQLISSDPSILVDAAHNPHGAEALARAVTESFSFTEIALVVGTLADKDSRGVLSALAPLAARVIVTPVHSPRTSDADALRDDVSDAIPGVAVESAPDLPTALDAARSWAAAAEGRGVLVAGSVVLAGEALAYARDEGWLEGD